ncbi:uncharacterized MFS-type transporter YxiO [Anaerolineaceae bacterium]|nr:uncharacterized MFS-type transporter YxiO [Anaerolineaceae bacterium]
MFAEAAPRINDKREIFGWAMYDWAISAFSTTVGTVFLGPYLAALARTAADASGMVYVLGVPIAPGSFLPYCISISVGMQAMFLPMLGAVADYSNQRKKMLMFFAVLGGVATTLLFFVQGNLWWLGGLLYVIANLCYGAAIVFYNAYLPEIASPDQRDRVSSYGWGIGYLGGGLLLLLNLILYTFSDRILGPDSGGLAVRINLGSAGIWWLGWQLITFSRLGERHATRELPPGENFLTIGYMQLGRLMQVPTWQVALLSLLPLATPALVLLGLPIWLAVLPILGPLGVLIIFLVRKYPVMPQTVKYLVAYLFFNDGVQTVIGVAAIFGAEELHLEQGTLIQVILMVQFVAFGGALLFGRLAGWFGTQRALIGSLVVWAAVSIYAYQFLTDAFQFWLLGAVIALVLGGSQALSRSLFAQMIPPTQEAEFYGFYEISERGTSWWGTLLFGLVNQIYGSMRLAILSTIVFFIVGLILLPFVNVEAAIADAKKSAKPHAAEA